MKYANENSNNIKYIFLTQSCIPVYNFRTVYDNIMSHNFSMINIVPMEQKKNGRFPLYQSLVKVFNRNDIIKHSSQMVLTKKHAEIFINGDKNIIKTFK